MSDFTYQVPDEKQYYRSLISYLTSQGDTDLVDIVRGSKISISDTSAYSRRRWNARYTEIIFHVSEEKLGKVDEYIKSELKRICDLLIPKDAGLDVMSIEFILDVDNMGAKSLIDDLGEISDHLLNIGKSANLPNDILSKAEEMSESYLYMFAVENYIRLFIHEVALEIHGVNYFDELSISRSIRDSVSLRKRQEEQNKWISVRGGTELFYLDFKDLGALITNNWGIFKKYFPEQSWITSKINELSNCRNLVAHNSYLGSHERDVIRVNFHSLIKQISIKRA